MIEAGVLLDRDGNPLHWHLPPNRSGAFLPDSRDLWDIIWENRKNLSGFAHSHPGFGVPLPSYTDLTTFAAVEAGLGQRLDWWIVSGDKLSLTGYDGDTYITLSRSECPSWMEELRKLSNYNM